jgi:hypothetical protein
MDEAGAHMLEQINGRPYVSKGAARITQLGLLVTCAVPYQYARSKLSWEINS